MSKLLASLLIVALYAAVAFFSPGYDDEYFNISIVEQTPSYARIVALANANDIHPPGQFIINRILFDLLGSWSSARAATAAIAAMTIVALWLSMEVQGAVHRAFAYLVICLNPSLLLWCTGLRWYAYFVPVLNLVVLTLMTNPLKPLLYWGLLTAGALALFHIGYLSLVIVPCVFLVALYQRRKTLATELWILGGLLLFAAAVAYPQATVFFTVHLKHASSQTATVVGALSGFAIHVLSNHGAVPVSIFGLALVTANIAIFAIALVKWRAVLLRPASLLLMLGAGGLLATSLSGNFRNLVTLSTLQGILQATTFGQVSNRTLRVLLVTLFSIGNLGGVYNVAAHTDTMKGSWNTPYALTLERYRATTADCSNTTAVTHDPVLAFRLRQASNQVIYVGEPNWQDRILARPPGCLVTFQTFRGSLPKDMASDYEAIIQALPGRVSTDRFGLDRFASFKRQVDADVPDYYVTMTLFRN
jgi:hypothetical protein